jgi:hypothetical protein
MSEPGRLLKNSRLEAIVVLTLWLITMIWTVGVSYWLGYGRDPSSLRFFLGIPDWVFFGVILPWAFSTIATIIFATRGMKDDDLGREQESGHE